MTAMRNLISTFRSAGLALALSLAPSCGGDTTPGPAEPTPSTAESEIPDWAEGSTIPSGVPGAPDIQIIKVVKNGSGPVCRRGKKATVKYKAMLANGTVKDPGRKPYEFIVGTSPVIQAWHTIVSSMRVGDSFTVKIPEAVLQNEPPRYANQGDWVFEMELLSVR